jgi:hypothetical protein
MRMYDLLLQLNIDMVVEFIKIAARKPSGAVITEQNTSIMRPGNEQNTKCYPS